MLSCFLLPLLPRKGQERFFLAMSEPQDTTTAPSTTAAPMPTSTSQDSPSAQQPAQVSSATAASAAATAAAASAAVANPPMNGTTTRPSEELSCLWQGCSEKCPSPEALYVSSPVFLFYMSTVMIQSTSSGLRVGLTHHILV